VKCVSKILLALLVASMPCLTLLARPQPAAAGYNGHVIFSGTASLGSPVQWQGGGGGFNFTSTVCAQVAGNDASASTCALSLSGTYMSTVCGTGSASGSGVLAGVDNYTVSSFSITIVAGVGVVTASVTDPAGVTTASSGVVDFATTAPGGAPGVGPGPSLTGNCAGNLVATGAVSLAPTSPDVYVGTTSANNNALPAPPPNVPRGGSIDIAVRFENAAGENVANLAFTWQVVWADGTTTAVRNGNTGNTGRVEITVNVANNQALGQAIFIVRRGDPPQIKATKIFNVTN
jgi:hypothetical protein